MAAGESGLLTLLTNSMCPVVGMPRETKKSSLEDGESFIEMLEVFTEVLSIEIQLGQDSEGLWYAYSEDIIVRPGWFFKKAAHLKSNIVGNVIFKSTAGVRIVALDVSCHSSKEEIRQEENPKQW